MDNVRTGLHEARVVSNEAVAEGLWRVVLSAPSLAGELQSGQFMNVAVPGDASQILRLPLSFSHADAVTGLVEIVYAVVGDGTRRFSQMRSGDVTTLVGPCGNPWPVSAGSGRVVLVAGGVGITPIVACARRAAEAGVAFEAVVGAQTAARLWGADVLSELGAGTVEVTTDDGSAGRAGFVTAALADLLATGGYEAVYACGPEPMMRAVAALCAERDVTCWVSCERMMCCGFGACGTCNLQMADGRYASVCKDGPVFNAEEVAW